MIRRPKTDYGSTTWDRLVSSFKSCTYSVMHELLQTQITTSWLYMTLITIESLQFLWYSVHTNFDFLWYSPSGDVFHNAIKYLQFDAFLHLSQSGKFFKAALYIAFGLQIMAILIFAALVFSIAVKSKKKASTLVTYTLKLFGLYVLLCNTILGIPFFNAFFSALHCKPHDIIHDSMTCYSGIYWLHLTIGIIGLIMYLGIDFLFQALFVELNPCSSTPFACPATKIGYCKLAFKIALPLYIVADYEV